MRSLNFCLCLKSFRPIAEACCGRLYLRQPQEVVGEALGARSYSLAEVVERPVVAMVSLCALQHGYSWKPFLLPEGFSVFRVRAL